MAVHIQPSRRHDGGTTSELSTVGGAISAIARLHWFLSPTAGAGEVSVRPLIRIAESHRLRQHAVTHRYRRLKLRDINHARVHSSPSLLGHVRVPPRARALSCPQSTLRANSKLATSGYLRPSPAP